MTIYIELTEVSGKKENKTTSKKEQGKSFCEAKREPSEILKLTASAFEFVGKVLVYFGDNYYGRQRKRTQKLYNLTMRWMLLVNIHVC